jgi:hypothetical protein
MDQEKSGNPDMGNGFLDPRNKTILGMVTSVSWSNAANLSKASLELDSPE